MEALLEQRELVERRVAALEGSATPEDLDYVLGELADDEIDAALSMCDDLARHYRVELPD